MYANFWSIFTTITLLVEMIPSLIIITLALTTKKCQAKL